jgi:hypothetical protein
MVSAIDGGRILADGGTRFHAEVPFEIDGELRQKLPKELHRELSVGKKRHATSLE